MVSTVFFAYFPPSCYLLVWSHHRVTMVTFASFYFQLKIFVVYIDDLVNAASLTCTTANGIYLFADDAKLFSDVPHELQTALDSINRLMLGLMIVNFL